ncbi:MAG: DUF748 domain-containing protein [Candidatus Electrothrix sp. YB6]
MAGEQQNNKVTSPPEFGEILINPHEETADGEQQESASEPTKKKPEEKSQQNPAETKPKQARPDRSSKRGLCCGCLFLFLLPPAVFLLYFAGARYLLPWYIQGPFADRLSEQLNRPVTIKTVEFSPFLFDLHLAGIEIGAERGSRDADDLKLCWIETIDTKVRPKELLRRQLVFADVQISQMQVNLLRRADGRYSDFAGNGSGLVKRRAAGLRLLPSWVRIHGLRLTEGTVSLYDAVNEKEYLLEQIECILPTGRAKPTLHAVINGSPVSVQGQRQAGEGGIPETRLSLRFDDIDPQNLLAWLPGANDTKNTLRISTKRTDAVAEIIIPDIPGAAGGVRLSGTAELSGLQILAGNGTGKAEQKPVQLSAPRARLVLQANPFRRVYTVEELTLDQPELVLVLSGNSGQPYTEQLLTGLAQLPDPAASEVGLVVRRLTVNQGTVTTGERNGQQWENLELQLSGFRNMRAPLAGKVSEERASAAALVFSAEQGGAQIHFEGAVTPDLNLSGKVALRNLESSLLQSYLSTSGEVRLAGGKADLTGILRTVEGQESKTVLMERATIKLRHFSLLPRKNGKNNPKLRPLLTAEDMEGTDCVVNPVARTASCDSLLLQHAEFSTAAPAFFLLSDPAENKVTFSGKAVKIAGSRARLALGGKAQQKDQQEIELTDLNMSLTKEQGKKSNLSLQAKVGESGTVSADGILGSGGSLLLTAENLDIRLFQQPFATLFDENHALALEQGHLNLKGRVTLPAAEFVGSIQMDKVMARSSKGTKGTTVGWQQGVGTGMTVRLVPFAADIKELAVQEPVIEFSAADSSLPAALVALLRTEENKAVFPPFTVEQLLISDGSLIRPGEEPKVAGIKGYFSPLKPGTETAFELTGRMNGAEFSVQGKTGRDRAAVDEFTVARMPMDSAAEELARALRLHRGELLWQGTPEEDDTGRVDCLGFTPLPDSDFSLLLALLTRPDGSFSLPLPSLPPMASPEKVGAAAIKELQRLRLQTVVSPQTVLEKFLPDFGLPVRVDCTVGSSMPDFVDGMENYAQLFALRPHLNLTLQGRYDDTADRQYFLQERRKELEYTTKLENIRRQEEMARLIAEEELLQAELISAGTPAAEAENKISAIQQREDLQQLPVPEAELPEQALPDLARQRAQVVYDYLIDTLKLPADRITQAEKGAAGKAGVDFVPVPHW